MRNLADRGQSASASMPEVQRISSRDNPCSRRRASWSHDPAASSQVGAGLVEADHLCEAALGARRTATPGAGRRVGAGRRQPFTRWLAFGEPRAIRPDALRSQGIRRSTARAIGLAASRMDRSGRRVAGRCQRGARSRLQDPGNVGSSCAARPRSASRQVDRLTGTAALWAPKVLRAGMGAHFALRMVEGVGRLRRCTAWLRAAARHEPACLTVACGQTMLPRPCAWVFGHEGQGVAHGDSRHDVR